MECLYKNIKTFAKHFIQLSFIYLLIDYLFKSEFNYFQTIAFSVTLSAYLTILENKRNMER